VTPPTLAGKRALIVGAGSGIGRAVHDAFVEAGAVVGVLEIDPDKCASLAAAHPSTVVVTGDAVSTKANDAAIDAVVARHGGLDVWVSCVGLFDFYKGVGALDPMQIPTAFDELFHVNVASMMVGVRTALHPLRASRGSVVLTCSTSGFYPGRGGVLYVASKFAVRGLVVALAHELAPDVRVNGVAPGGTVGTDLRGPAALGLDEQSLGDRPGRSDELAARTPLAVALTPIDIAQSYVFLASDGARGITGTFLHPDGGIDVKA
jgi:NAD(P)-dependent dehydrogenase (short-subunit alcohol dehydrogenase family)